MSLLLALLQWLFGRRFQAADRWRLRRADYAAYMLGEIRKGWVFWDDPEDRAWLLDNLVWIERAAFLWAPRRCRMLREAMGFPLSLEAVYVRLEEARIVLLGPRTKPIHGKGRKIRKGRKFLHRKKLVAWRAKRRRMRVCPLRAARDPPGSDSSPSTRTRRSALRFDLDRSRRRDPVARGRCHMKFSCIPVAPRLFARSLACGGASASGIL